MYRVEKVDYTDVSLFQTNPYVGVISTPNGQLVGITANHLEKTLRVALNLQSTYWIRSVSCEFSEEVKNLPLTDYTQRLVAHLLKGDLLHITDIEGHTSKVGLTAIIKAYLAHYVQVNTAINTGLGNADITLQYAVYDRAMYRNSGKGVCYADGAPVKGQDGMSN